MDEECREKQPIEIETPLTEEEVPFEPQTNSDIKRKGRTREIDAKDNRAFWLTCGCLVFLCAFGFIDALTERDILDDSKMLESLFEIIKYVITTSLGFFFATTISKKE